MSKFALINFATDLRDVTARFAYCKRYLLVKAQHPHKTGWAEHGLKRSFQNAIFLLFELSFLDVFSFFKLFS